MAGMHILCLLEYSQLCLFVIVCLELYANILRGRGHKDFQPIAVAIRTSRTNSFVSRVSPYKK